MADDPVLIAHLLRRTGFGPAPGEVESHASYDDALDAVLAAAVDDGTSMPDPDYDDGIPLVRWWIERMRTTDTPLHEKLVLFWHGHLTSSADKATPDMLARQHDLFRRHALGNFRELLRAVLHDAAMLVFLDAAGSSAEAPNENLARELFELFTLGRGAYSEADVRAAARALAGFTVDWDSEAVGFDEDSANTRSLRILGAEGRFDADALVDLVCDHPACAPFVAGRLHRFLTGVEPDDARRNELAGVFTAAGLEIRPLVEHILRHPSFVELRLTRARFPVEWFVAAHKAAGKVMDEDSVWNLEELGQLPLHPPNVAGWPAGVQWAGPGRQLLRASVALDLVPEDLALDGGSPAGRVDAALRRCGLFEVSDASRDALVGVADRVAAEDGGDTLLLALALASPEAATC